MVGGHQLAVCRWPDLDDAGPSSTGGPTGHGGRRALQAELGRVVEAGVDQLLLDGVLGDHHGRQQVGRDDLDAVVVGSWCR